MRLLLLFAHMLLGVAVAILVTFTVGIATGSEVLGAVSGGFAALSMGKAAAKDGI